MAVIGEQSLQWFSTAERVEAEPDLAALVRDYSPLLYRVALSLLRNPSEAEDVVQDTFVRVLERRRQLCAIVELRPWLVRIAWNLAIDRTRSKRPQQLDEQIVFCERGHVELEFAGAGQIFKLSPGDTLHCRAQLLHRVSNTGKGEAAYMMTGRFPHSVHATFTADLNS